MPSVVENGDKVFVEGGTYTIASSLTISKAITLESDEDNPATVTVNNGVIWGLVFNIQNEEDSGLEVNLNNIDFNRNGTGNAYGVRAVLGNKVDGNFMNVHNCSFTGFRRQWAGGALEINSESSNNYVLVTDCRFTNNTAYSYGHLGSCLIMNGHYGKMRVYRCIFNNPSGDNMKFCGSKGRAIGACNGDDAVYFDCRGSCNQFLGTGDIGCFKNYTEETCED